MFNYLGHIYSHRATYIPSWKVKQHLVLEILCLQGFTKFSDFWLLVTSHDLWPPWKTIQIIYSPSATYIPSLKIRQHLLLEISCLQSFILWPLVTSNDLSPPWKTIGIIYLPRATYISSLKFKKLLLLEISCLQAKASHARTHTHTYTHANTIA